MDSVGESRKRGLPIFQRCFKIKENVKSAKLYITAKGVYEAKLNAMIKDNGTRLATGFVGTPYLLYALSENGYVKTAYDLLLHDKNPSWLFSVDMGATTVWEHWDGIKEDGSFWSKEINSFNHYAYGAVVDWMY